MTIETPIAEINAIYCGSVLDIKEKLCALWLPEALIDRVGHVNDCITLASPFEWKARELPRIVGLSYGIKGRIDDEGKLQSMQIKFNYLAKTDRRLPTEIIAGLEAREKALAVQRRIEKNYNDLRTDDHIMRALKPIKDRYRTTDRIGRLALEVVLLDILRNSS